MSLKDLEEKLYSPARKPKKEIPAKKKKEADSRNDVPMKWEEKTKEESSSFVSGLAVWLRRFIWVAVPVMILTAAAGIYLAFYFSGSKDVSLALDGPREILLGVPFEVTVSLDNKTSHQLRQTKLNLVLPEGILELGKDEEHAVSVFDAGDVEPADSAQAVYRLIAVDGKNSIKRFKASVSYEIQALGRGSRFEEARLLDMKIGESALFVDLKAPTQVLNSQVFDIALKYRNISQQEFPDFELFIEYPLSFNFISSSITPSKSNNVWDFDRLGPEEEGEIIIKGSMVGASGSFFGMGVSFRTVFEGRQYTISTKTASFAIAPSPFSLSVLLNGKADYIARIGDKLTYSINYRNASNVGMVDVIIKAKLVGELLDLSTLRSKAGFNSITNTLIWNVATNPELRLVQPGTSGSAVFEIKLQDSFPIKRLNDKNFFFRVEAEIESPTIPGYIEALKTTAMESLETKVAGMVKIDSKAYFRDADSGIINGGPMPPQVNQATQYTIHWVITNYSTDVSDVEVRASLAPSVGWTGEVKSNNSSLPLYNDRTQEIVWNIGKIPATKGIVGEPVEAIFQIEATPSILNKNNYQPLIGPVSLIAADDFVGFRLSASDVGIDSSLPDDPTIGEGGGKVIE